MPLLLFLLQKSNMIKGHVVFMKNMTKSKETSHFLSLRINTQKLQLYPNFTKQKIVSF